MMHALLERLVLLVKRRSIVVDRRISSAYLLGLFVSKFLMACRGMIRLRRMKLAFIGSGVTLKEVGKIEYGPGLVIDQGCFVDALSCEGIRFGTAVSLNKQIIIECTGSLTNIGKGLVIGDNVGLGAGCFLGCAGGIEIGTDTIIGNFVSFHSENHNFDNPDLPIRQQGVSRQGIRVGKNCWIGAKVTVLDGAVIEDGCVFAAGAVVAAGIYRKNSIYGGVPAKFIKSRVVEEGVA
ncbi:hypothetical protein DM813_24100 [Pseudomonas alkylphenolica]|uniref:Acyltransferase n=1 Tax=Pseudomonas alkylphenolica TaxID=237609 RepID=A0A443ZG12_9PSED|nr:acyltransferase [Pseudomonas alkylphenolica]RWU17772.1 hypothetical protein DM813_24100 [Pseudomonas alkylphenolica]